MTKDSVPGGGSGLLSKVVKFVKSPTTHWSDLDRVEADNGDTESRLALKEMIERKRRNDFVRNREFDMLRKLRRRETLTDEDALPGQASFYPSSQPANTGERARTLKKIDEIEAQMATAWFKRKGGEGTERGAAEGDAAPHPHTSSSYSKTDPMPLDRGPALPLEPAPVQAFAPTEQMSEAAFQAERARVRTGAATPPVLDQPVHKPPPLTDLGLLPVGQDLQVEVVVQSNQDPEIEEAAIRFANGDPDGAEAGLRELVAEGASRADDVDVWLTLFDLYRATGDQDKFDDTALHFAARFGRSAPQWTRDVELTSSAPAPMAGAAATTGKFDWVCPSNVGMQSVASLNATLARNAPPWRIDWRYLKTIDPAALPALTEVFRRWADEISPIRFLAPDHALQVLAAQSPTDDRNADPAWWGARLALLRVMGEMDEFELVALNYCVTYEVSPPAWEDPLNGYGQMTEDGETILPSELESEVVSSLPRFGATDIMGAHTMPFEDGVLRMDLEGELTGSADAALSATPSSGTTQIEFNCRKLLRVDFGAAGDLLNWAMDQQGQGRQVRFKQVNRLVAAFFGVIGITEAARVVLRTD